MALWWLLYLIWSEGVFFFLNWSPQHQGDQKNLPLSCSATGKQGDGFPTKQKPGQQVITLCVMTCHLASWQWKIRSSPCHATQLPNCSGSCFFVYLRHCKSQWVFCRSACFWGGLIIKFLLSRSSTWIQSFGIDSHTLYQKTVQCISTWNPIEFCI